MQFDLGSDPRTDILRCAQTALTTRFGRIFRPPGKRRSPEWVLVHGVIGAQTKTAASNASAAGLRAEYGSWEAAAAAPVAALEARLHRQTFPGVARKNSAGVMNASTFNRRAMVIDGHHRRIMQRIGLVPQRADTARAYDALMPILPQEWSAADLDEHHLLVKTLGQQICRPTSPHCGDCPVQDICKFGLAKRKS